MLLKVTDPDGTEVTTLGSLERKTSGEETGFDITTQTGLITIADNYEIVSTGTVTQEWKVEIIFVNLDSDQNANTGKSFSASLIIQEESTVTSLGNFAEYITTQVYTGTDGENNLYYHDVDLANGAGDNSYRYSGANPNNYVCFGSDAASCPADNLYRIIGVFGNQVKLIKATSIGNYAWDGTSSDYSSIRNTSTKPDIYTTLNTTYYNTLGSEWQNLIVETTWQVGGMSYSNGRAIPKTVYDEEVGTGQSGYEETMRIGLMYVSDYAYGANPEKWTTTLSTSNYGKDNWLYNGDDDWTISRRTDHGYGALVLSPYYSGNVMYDNVYTTNHVRPSFYLESSVVLSSGDGTEQNPFRIVV